MWILPVSSNKGIIWRQEVEIKWGGKSVVLSTFENQSIEFHETGSQTRKLQLISILARTVDKFYGVRKWQIVGISIQKAQNYSTILSKHHDFVRLRGRAWRRMVCSFPHHTWGWHALWTLAQLILSTSLLYTTVTSSLEKQR